MLRSYALKCFLGKELLVLQRKQKTSNAQLLNQAHDCFHSFIAPHCYIIEEFWHQVSAQCRYYVLSCPLETLVFRIKLRNSKHQTKTKKIHGVERSFAHKEK